jgi:SAM-dependent methyltransferase
MNALEYGAGTGILSFLLSEKLGHITMMDSSPGMVKVMEEKVQNRNATNLLPVCFDLEQESSGQEFQLIFNQMVLHHIKNVKSILEKFYHMLSPDGILVIADLYSEDGTFHGDGFDGHLGFDPVQLEGLLHSAGFRNIRHEECYSVKRNLDDGTVKSFPIFVLTSTK